MNIVNRLGKMCDSLGVNNKATYPVMLIALVKGICRPTFTMMDKTEKPETKKYTALREGLTEIIAIPTYWACGELTAKLASKFKFKKELPEDVQKSLIKRASKNMMFIGVCTAALFVIPGLCSVAIKPIMDKIMPDYKPNKKQNPEDLNKTASLPVNTVNTIFARPSINNFTGRKAINSVYNTQIKTGMKVGGV